MDKLTGGITSPRGFRAGACSAEIKYRNRDDMAMVVSDIPSVLAGTFTTNRVKAACVKWDMELNSSGRDAQAIVVNSGIANACTGEEGLEACRATALAVEESFGIPSDMVAIASTGVIGMQLPVDKLRAGVKALESIVDYGREAGEKASRAIMTTDTLNKEVAAAINLGGHRVVLGGMSKGSGMIHPNMCTMLGFLTTDAAISKEMLQRALSDVVSDTFNMITVDGDTSTNDTLLIMANGMAGNDRIVSEGEDYNTFKEALFYICRELAMKMAGDGEGATALFEAIVVNAATKEDAKKMARAVVGSNLSKAAIYGHDANFGRFLCACGYSGAEFDENNLVLSFRSRAGELKVFDHGIPLEFDEELAGKILSENHVTVYIDVNEGHGEATAWGCDLTHKYVDINADYRS